MKFRVLVVVTTILTFALILLGGYVKATGAGDACGADWPKCKGTFSDESKWFPAPSEMTQLDWTEYAHRMVAFIAGPFILGTAAMAWFRERDNAPLRYAALAAAVLLPLQILIGGITVLFYGAGNPAAQEMSVVLHLGVACLIFAALVVAAAFSFHPPAVSAPRTRKDAKAKDGAKPRLRSPARRTRP